MSQPTREPTPKHQSRTTDPLGLRALEAAIASLVATAAQLPEGGAVLTPRITELKGAHRRLSDRLDLLRDRYALLKRSNAALAEEVAWLRDQLDDLACEELPPEEVKAPHPEGEGRRRYSDRWS